MAELKTKKNDGSVEAFIASVPDARQQADTRALVEIFKDITRAEPKMWGTAIIGFGDSHYLDGSGRAVPYFKAGFSPRKKDLTFYLMGGHEQYPDILKSLGKHKTGKACLYIHRLEDVHLPTLKKLIRTSVKSVSKQGK